MTSEQWLKKSSNIYLVEKLIARRGVYKEILQYKITNSEGSKRISVYGVLKKDSLFYLE